MNEKFPNIYHIGCMKTGTTTIQNVLQQDTRLNVIIYSRFFNTNQWYYQKYQHYIQGKINIESDENIIRSYGPLYGLTTSLSRIKKVAPTAHIIVTIREQRDLLRSAYNHHISRTIDPFTFQQFLDSPAGISYLKICNYHKVFKTINSFFPKEQIHFFLFEDLKIDYIKFFYNFYKEGLQLNPPQEIPELKSNKSAPQNIIDLKRRLNRYFIFNQGTALHNIERKLHYKLLTLFKRIKFYQGQNSQPSFRLPDKLIMEFQEENKALEKELQLPLTERGYLT